MTSRIKNSATIIVVVLILFISKDNDDYMI